MGIFEGEVERLEIVETEVKNVMEIRINPKDGKYFTLKGEISDIIVHNKDKISVENHPYVYVTNGFWRFSAKNVHVLIEQYKATGRYAISIKM